jgi:hypothetical protein
VVRHTNRHIYLGPETNCKIVIEFRVSGHGRGDVDKSHSPEHQRRLRFWMKWIKTLAYFSHHISDVPCPRT